MESMTYYEQLDLHVSKYTPETVKGDVQASR